MHFDQLTSRDENSVVFLMLIAFERHKCGFVNLSHLLVAKHAKTEKSGDEFRKDG